MNKKTPHWRCNKCHSEMSGAENTPAQCSCGGWIESSPLKTTRKKVAISEPVWGGETARKNMAASAEFLKANREEQIAKATANFRLSQLNGEVTGLTRRTPIEDIRQRISSAAIAIRSWHSWGEPSPFGKAVCARLREEIICYAAVKRALLQ